ncbi:serine/threonine-protein kinase Nek2-like [Sycon ciliatum]|uniref:serine/threonine-protein kinase Nek2-like n=1 Tax=Sycon ciliatum TaxID=27933 RepID=UPI0020AAE189|eukprot:scpid81993/ scgid28615/ Serine/threonine-protein kinase Nek2; HSPK 21; Never in mitosis A-related kinase 2; NimA-like protein kinase 1
MGASTSSLDEVPGEPLVDSLEFSEQFLARYEPLRKIGSGAFGSAYVVRERTTNAVWCAKKINVQSQNVPQEVQSLKKNESNAHTVTLYETVHDVARTEYYIVMEYCQGGTLKNWIRRNHRNKLLTEPVVLAMLYKICEAVQACHALHTLHRDIKPENIFLDVNGNVKLGDFGVSRQLGDQSAARSFCGTPPYMAPELFLSYMNHIHGGPPVGYNFLSDIWSIGCVLLDMSNKFGVLLPDRKHGLGLAAAEAMNPQAGAVNMPALPDIPKLIDEEIPPSWKIVRRLLSRMLCFKAEERISLLLILTDPELRRSLQYDPSAAGWHEGKNEVRRFSKMSDS